MNKSKSILVVDDDPIFRILLAKMLKVRGLDVIEAENGFAAVKTFEKRKHEISLIVSDVKMPTMDGVEFLKRVRSQSSIPFILFTGLTDIMESKQAYELGANEFILKPIDLDGIKKIMEWFKRAESDEALAEAERVPAATDYRRIQLDEFLSTTTIQSDIYIRLSESKFVKVGRKGEPTPVERLKYYRDKKVDFLYVLNAEFGIYVEHAATFTKKIVQSSAVTDDAKLKLLAASTKLIAENAFLSPNLDKVQIDAASSILENTIDFAAKDPAIFKQLLDLQSHSDHLFAHSLAVSLYASLVAKQHGWVSSSTLTKISLGGLLHDVGKKELSKDLLQKSRKELTPSEIREIESHCERGRDILLDIQGLPEEIALIALHHHETKTGTGYPRRLRGEQINPLARLVYVVDRFVSYILPSNPDDKQLDFLEAVRKMQTFFGEEMDPALFKSLMETRHLHAP